MVRCRRVATASVSETTATAQARSTAAFATLVASNQRNATRGRPQRRDRRRLTGRRTARPRPSRYRFRVIPRGCGSRSHTQIYTHCAPSEHEVEMVNRAFAPSTAGHNSGHKLSETEKN